VIDFYFFFFILFNSPSGQSVVFSFELCLIPPQLENSPAVQLLVWIFGVHKVLSIEPFPEEEQNQQQIS